MPLECMNKGQWPRPKPEQKDFDKESYLYWSAAWEHDRAVAAEARLAVVADERDGLLTIRHQFAEENTRLHTRLASAEAWRDYYRAKWLGDRAVPQPEPPADSADDGLRQLQRESEDLGLYGPQSAHQHWPGQVQCEWCKGTGAIDAPTSADDPTCPNCDGEGRWAKLQT